MNTAMSARPIVSPTPSTEASTPQAGRASAPRRATLAVAFALFAALGACGGGGDDSSAAAAPSGGGAEGAGSLVFTGTNNSGRTGFTPPADSTSCLAAKAAFIQVNCLKPGATAGTTDDLMITYTGATTVGTVVNLAAGGADQVEFLTTELSGTAVVTKFWGSEPKGTLTVTAIDAKSVTFKLAGISLKADPLGGSSPSTGAILADGSVTITLK